MVASHAYADHHVPGDVVAGKKACVEVGTGVEGGVPADTDAACYYRPFGFAFAGNCDSEVAVLFAYIGFY